MVDKADSKLAEVENRMRAHAMLLDIIRASTSEARLDAVLGEIAILLAEALQLREGMLFLVDGHNRHLTLRAAYGFDSNEELLGCDISFGADALSKAAQFGEAITIEDLMTTEVQALWEPIPRSGSIAILPIVHHGRTLGLIAVTRAEVAGFSEFETQLLEAICDQLSLTIRHAELREEARRDSQSDELTGLGNLRLLRTQLEDELHRAERFGHAVSVLSIDVDHFHALNDRHGQATGDVALRKLAGLMTRKLRRIDTVARTGGEEFVVLLPRTNLSEAAQVATKLRSVVERTEFPGGEGQPDGMLTVSVGVATLRPDETSDGLLARADAALREAKDRGRNCVVTSSQPVPSARSLTKSRI